MKGLVRGRRGMAGVGVVVVLWGGACVGLWRMVGYVEGVRVEMVDVGDGSGYVIRSGYGVMVYDCGSLDYRVGGVVERLMIEGGARRIDVVVVSHDNLDHFNGLVALAHGGGWLFVRGFTLGGWGGYSLVVGMVA